MLSAPSMERRKQPACVKSRKSSPIQFAGVDFLTASFPKSPVSPPRPTLLRGLNLSSNRAATVAQAFSPLTGPREQSRRLRGRNEFDRS